MSNYVMNTLSASRIGKLPIYSRGNGKRTFDFGKLIPAPESFKHLPEKSTSLQLMSRDRWMRDCWGTEGNAVHCYIGMDEISFLTTGGAPTPVIRALAAKYPEKEFVHAFLHEDNMKTIYINIYEYGVLVDSKYILNPYYQRYVLYGEK